MQYGHVMYITTITIWWKIITWSLDFFLFFFLDISTLLLACLQKIYDNFGIDQKETLL